MLEYSQPAASKDTERAVIRDVWIYTVGLFVVLAAVGLFMTGSLSVVALLLLICIVAGLGITWLTHIEYAAARQYGRAPRITRIFN